ncbi:MAG: TIGR03013 family PEP-CTERM/XrtA system glycosyltransferase [Myxococcales bacterium]|nr:TIGR03013 family PEP-CTERM/XrtA system glycosyltransferase [Myxococcales bacterium]
MFDLIRSPRRILVFLFEMVLVGLLVVLAGVIRLGVHTGLSYANVGKRAIVFAVVMQGVLYYAGFFDPRFVRQPQQAFSKVLKSLALSTLVNVLVYYLFPRFEIGRGIYLSSVALVAVVLPSWRIFYDSVTDTAGFRRKVIVLGTSGLGKELAEMIRDNPSYGLDLVGMLGRERSMIDSEQGIVGIYADLAEIVAKEDVELVLVAYPDRRGTLPVDQLLEVKFRGVEVQEGIDFYEEITGKIYVRDLKPSQLIFAEGFTARLTTRRLKRILDVVCALIGLVLAAPIMLLATVLIRLESKGPILYKQVRAGEFGKLFTILKFRSMRIDAEKHGAQFAKENDDRVTKVGAFIRKTRIDELPQLWNVLKGEMSMVGPRPERPVFIEQLEQQVPFFRQRLYVKPGVTGHAQVRCKYGASAEDMLEKLEYDLYYIKSYSVLFDLSVMLDTVKVVLFRIGSR